MSSLVGGSTALDRARKMGADANRLGHVCPHAAGDAMTLFEMYLA